MCKTLQEFFVLDIWLATNVEGVAMTKQGKFLMLILSFYLHPVYMDRLLKVVEGTLPNQAQNLES